MEKMLPKSAPLEEEMATDWFAEQFELSGSEIREVWMQAAVQAAAEGCGIGNRHIARAVKWCMAKYGRAGTEEELVY